MEFIQGEKFVELANNTDIFYRHTHDADDFLRNPPKNDFILITHNSDGKITDKPGKYDADINLMPDNLKKWYGQNVDITHDKVESLPIGLENSQWFPQIKKIENMMNIKNKSKDFKNLVYLNLNIKNNVRVRQPIYNLMNNMSYVTVVYGRNGLSFDKYLYNLYNHKFMICPEGNGIDVHQPWESLYINTIPIQKKNINNKNWRELPICWLDDWSQLRDEEFLNSEYERITNNNFDLSKIDFNYWKNKIINTI